MPTPGHGDTDSSRISTSTRLPDTCITRSAADLTSGSGIVANLRSEYRYLLRAVKVDGHISTAAPLSDWLFLLQLATVPVQHSLDIQTKN